MHRSSMPPVPPKTSARRAILKSIQSPRASSGHLGSAELALKEVPGPAPWAPLAGSQPHPPWEWRGARRLGRREQPRSAQGLCPFPVPRTPPPFAENPVFPLICAQPCSAGDLNVFHRLDRLRGSRQGRGVRKRPSDRLQRRPSRGPLSPLAGDTY